VQYIGFWGAKGREHKNHYDDVVLHNLNQYLYCLNRIIPIKWYCILCDEHALFNGYDRQKVYSYLKEIEIRLLQIGIEVLWMSDIWTDHKIKTLVDAMLLNLYQSWEKHDLSEILFIQAARHSSNLNTPEYNSLYYYTMRRVEARALEQIFGTAVFYSFASDKLKELCPDMPKLYLWSQKRGISKAPWLY